MKDAKDPDKSAPRKSKPRRAWHAIAGGLAFFLAQFLLGGKIEVALVGALSFTLTWLIVYAVMRRVRENADA